MEKIKNTLFEDRSLETAEDSPVVAGKPCLITFQTNETTMDSIPDEIEIN